MNWKHFLFAILAAGVAGSFTDWLFAGVLFHDKYLAYPEVWRQELRQDDTGAITWSTILGFLTAVAFVSTCVVFGIRGYHSTPEFAALVWLMVPLPLTITNALFIKLHPLMVVSHSLGWLAKLAVAALAASWLLG